MSVGFEIPFQVLFKVPTVAQFGKGVEAMQAASRTRRDPVASAGATSMIEVSNAMRSVMSEIDPAPQEKLERRAVCADTLAIPQVDGLRLNVRTWGSGNYICLLIHGFADSSHVWNEFAPTIPLNYQALAIDLRGHGDSDWDPKGRYDADSHVEDLSRLLKKLDRRKIVIIGHSMGGDIASRLAAGWAERILGVVIVDFGLNLDAAGIEQVRSEFAAANQIYSSVSDYERWLEFRRPLVRRDVLHTLARSALRPHPTSGFQLKADPAMLAAGSDVCNFRAREAALTGLLAAMWFPVLVVRGEASSVLSRTAAKRTVAALPHGRLQSVRMAGHAVMVDSPEGFTEAVRPFLRSLISKQ
jgi:pimeloyl-ACP methyl ester carboxylesterase